MKALFSLTVFASAGLLFLVQPMVGRMMLPLFGGAAAVWNTCLVFYQAALLLGYLYAHASSRRLTLRQQWLGHGVLLLLVLLLLPIHVSARAPSGESGPILAVLWRLATTVGAPFVALSATGTLLQSWFSRTGHRQSGDPYFLYAASNLGSMLALLGYPILVEPRLGLAGQSRVWSWGFGLLVALTLACGRVAALSGGAAAVAEVIERSAAPVRWQRLAWIGVAFVPSSLMMGVTLFLTTDIAPVPLLWIIPLSLYLLAFSLAFARLPARLVEAAGLLAGPVVMTLLFFLLSEMRYPTWAAFLLHLGALFLVCLTYLGKLAATRPGPERLTEFYLWISLGGVLGGVFNALVAPLLFKTTAEYLLMLIVAVALMRSVRLSAEDPAKTRSKGAVLAEVAVAVGIGILTRWLVTVPAPLSRIDLTALGSLIGFPRWRVTTLLTYLLPMGLCFLCYALRRTTAFALALAAVALVCTYDNEADKRIVLRHRSFYGVLTVTDDAEGDCRHLLSGRTPHGRQFLDAASRSTPLAFYLERGPVGDIFREFAGPKRKDQVAVVGLGTGTLASYGEPGQRMTFYEIDPAVAQIAEQARLFTYLSDSRAAVDVVLGDARLKLAEAPPRRYGLMLIDAFSSDAIPVHLLTREALALYLDKLAPDGVIAIHISNRYLDLAGLAGRLAADAGLAIRIQTWRGGDGCAPLMTRWVILARDERHLGELASGPGWEQVAIPAGTPLWTDDYSNLVALLDLR